MIRDLNLLALAVLAFVAGGCIMFAGIGGSIPGVALLVIGLACLFLFDESASGRQRRTKRESGSASYVATGEDGGGSSPTEGGHGFFGHGDSGGGWGDGGGDGGGCGGGDGGGGGE